jgi:hypothetical protein
MKAKIPLINIPIIILAVLCLFISCNTNTKPQKTNNEEPTHGQAGQTGSMKISKAEYDSTKVDVQHFIEELNQIIRRKDYNAWKAALSREYFAQIASIENLQQLSELPAMKTRGITLKSAEDYFINVVVPSRANSRVDDIEFIGEHRVKAFTIMTNNSGEEQRLRLYDLEKTGNIWKIIN